MLNLSDAWVEANDLRIHWYGTNDDGKPPLLLLHGRTDNGACWGRVASRLAGDYRVIAPDARGHGLTRGRVSGTSRETLADDAAALIRALELDRPAVFGHSMGAFTAMLLAANHPELARAIVLEDPPLFDGPRDEREVEESAREAIRTKSLSAQELEASLIRNNPTWAREEIVPAAEAQLQYDPEILRLNEPPPDWREMVSRIRCPFLLIIGDPALGALVSPERAEEVLALSPHGRVVHILRAGHSIHRDRFEETMRAVEEFLSSV